jgi:hypothetical protein
MEADDVPHQAPENHAGKTADSVQHGAAFLAPAFRIVAAAHSRY